MGACNTTNGKLNNSCNTTNMDTVMVTHGDEVYNYAEDAFGHVRYFGNPKMHETHIWGYSPEDAQAWRRYWNEVLEGKRPWKSEVGDEVYDDPREDPDPRCDGPPQPREPPSHCARAADPRSRRGAASDVVPAHAVYEAHLS